MKKFTIITLPEFGDQLLEAVGRAGVAQLIEVTGPEFEALKRVEIKVEEPWIRLYSRYKELLELAKPYMRPIEVPVPSADFREIVANPETKVSELMAEMDEAKVMIDGLRAIEEKLAKVKELEENLRTFEDRIRALEEMQRNLKDLEEEIEVGKYLGVSLVEEATLRDVLPIIEVHLKRLKGISYSVRKVSPQYSLLQISGPEKLKTWVRAILSLFDIKGIELQAKEVDEEIQRIKSEIDRIQSEIGRAREIRKVKDETCEIVSRTFSRIGAIARFIEMKALKPPYAESESLYVLQGWIEDRDIPVLTRAVEEVKKATGVDFAVRYEDPKPGEEVPSSMIVHPSFFNIPGKLVQLRGWRAYDEVNPTLISLLVYFFMFGMMFGDVGQGLLLILIGYIAMRKAKRGLFYRIGSLFIPMGISATIFGFLYGEVFLIEGLIHPLLFSPIHKVTTLMKLVLGIAVIEMCIGLVIAAINSFKAGEPIRALGEHGLGFILFLVGIYFFGLHFLAIDNVFVAVSHWSFALIATGLSLSLIEPIISGKVGVHKVGTMEAIGEGVAGLLIVFVEGLCNFFSFLRIAAFALAHSCLALAAHALSVGMGPFGLILTNLIAMTFELVSSSVQGLRLLFYEFMGKFYKGTGKPFQPFTLFAR